MKFGKAFVVVALFLMTVAVPAMARGGDDEFSDPVVVEETPAPGEEPAIEEEWTTLESGDEEDLAEDTSLVSELAEFLGFNLDQEVSFFELPKYRFIPVFLHNMVEKKEDSYPLGQTSVELIRQTSNLDTGKAELGGVLASFETSKEFRVGSVSATQGAEVNWEFTTFDEGTKTGITTSFKAVAVTQPLVLVVDERNLNWNPSSYVKTKSGAYGLRLHRSVAIKVRTGVRGGIKVEDQALYTRMVFSKADGRYVPDHIDIVVGLKTQFPANFKFLDKYPVQRPIE